MATVNGTATPPESQQHEPAVTSGTKRKRSSEDVPVKDNHPANPPQNLEATDQLDLIRDVVEILQSHAYAKQVLDSNLAEAQEQIQDRPSLKRAKLDATIQTETITSRSKKGAYATLAQLGSDIHDVCAAQLAAFRNQSEQEKGVKKRLSADTAKKMQQLISFESLVSRIVERQTQHGSELKKDRDNAESSLDGIKQEPETPDAVKPAQAGRTVLSLFGNAPTPRQLFSSLQHIDSPEVPLEELGLPSMLTASRLLPVQAVQATQRAPKPTFGESFAPSATAPQLQPPKLSKHASNRSNSITFLPIDTVPKPSKKNTFYPTQPLNVGNWITYGYSDKTRDMASPSSKRKQRDRSLSAGESTRQLTTEEADQEDLAQEEALFKAAFSSFAPTHDNSKAIVAARGRGLVWWRKSGSDRFGRHFSAHGIQNDEEDVLHGDVASADPPSDEARQFQEAIEAMDGESIQLDEPSSELDLENAGVDELMTEISDLLQGLASHQRIRTSQMAAPTRTPASPSPLLSARLGTPSEPSAEETDTYRVLRSRLAEVVSRLPPYIVSKLNGEQLEDLRVCQRIVIEGRQYKGVLEEDQASRLARSANAAAANLAGRSSTTASQSYNPLGRQPLAAATSTTRSAHAPQSFYGGSKTPAPNYGRSSASQSFNTPAGANRSGYSQFGAFSAPANRATQPPSYGQNNNASFYQNKGFGQSYSQGSPQPLAQRQGSFPIGSAQAALQARGQNTTAYGQNAGSPYQRPDSPAKPLYSVQTPQLQQRGPPQIPAPSAHASLQNFQTQQPGSGRSTPTGLGQPTNHAATPNAYSATPSAATIDQQKIMLERQRAQLAAQPQARMAAQADLKQESPAPPQQQAPQTGQVNGVASGP